MPPFRLGITAHRHSKYYFNTAGILSLRFILPEHKRGGRVIRDVVSFPDGDEPA